jgi:hypothetical protein
MRACDDGVGCSNAAPFAEIRRAPGCFTEREKAPAVTAAEAPVQSTQDEPRDSDGVSMAQQAAEVIEGESYARAWLERMQAGTAEPGELTVILAFLQGELLHGACRLIEKAMEGRRHA